MTELAVIDDPAAAVVLAASAPAYGMSPAAMGQAGPDPDRMSAGGRWYRVVAFSHPRPRQEPSHA